MIIAIVVCALQSGFKASFNFNLNIKSFSKMGELDYKNGCSLTLRNNNDITFNTFEWNESKAS